MLSKFFTALAFVGLPPAAFFAGYALTERVFRWNVVPFPFEPSGIAVGIGCFFWTLAVLMFVVGKKKRRGL